MTSPPSDPDSSPQTKQLARNPSFNPNEYEKHLIMNASDEACEAHTDSISQQDVHLNNYNTAQFLRIDATMTELAKQNRDLKAQLSQLIRGSAE